MQSPKPRDGVRPLLRTRQVREFTSEPVEDADVDAIVDAARWSGSSGNSQPWRFVVIRDPEALLELAEAGQPQTRALATAKAAIAIVLPQQPGSGVMHAFDEG